MTHMSKAMTIHKKIEDISESELKKMARKRPVLKGNIDKILSHREAKKKKDES